MTSASNHTAIKYRPEIDGLRTIAVLSVLLYHAEITIRNQQIFKGGFLGVDIFFVISGFLITSLIIKERRDSGKFSFQNFYDRRARRLLPALLVVMLASLPFAWIYLSPSQLMDFSKSLIASLIFGSNFYWWETLGNYGAESALLRPFLHTWSLAVEEQYYIVYPALLLGIYRLSKAYVVESLLVLLVLSLVLAEVVSPRNQDFSFYLLPTRFWELVAGGIAALMLGRYPMSDRKTLYRRMLPAVGICLIAYSVAYIGFDNNHPGLITLIPVTGTLLIIWFGNDDELITRILSSSLFVSIGLISYSLYLWHYPVFAFGRLAEISPSLWEKLLWIALSFLLAIVTYFVIEKPFRNKSRIPGKKAATTLLASAAMVLVFSSVTIQGNGIKERFSDLIELYGQNEFDNEVLRGASWTYLNEEAEQWGFEESSAGTPSDFEKGVLWYSRNENAKRILILGNSHSRDLFNAIFQNLSLFNDIEVARFGMELCEKKHHRDLLESPNFIHADAVIISTRYNLKCDDIAILPALIRQLMQEGKLVYVASSTVEFNDSTIRETIFDREMMKFVGLDESSQPDRIAEEINKKYYSLRDRGKLNINEDVQKIAEIAGAKYIDKQELVCDSLRRVCYGVTPDHFKAIYDYGHWTLEGAKYFGQRIKQLDWLGLNSELTSEN